MVRYDAVGDVYRTAMPIHAEVVVVEGAVEHVHGRVRVRPDGAVDAGQHRVRHRHHAAHRLNAIEEHLRDNAVGDGDGSRAVGANYASVVPCSAAVAPAVADQDVVQG